MDDQSDVFSRLFVRSLELTDNNEAETEKTISELLQFDYGQKIFAITKQISGEILCHYAASTPVLQSKNCSLLENFFQLIVHLTSSQEIILEVGDVNTLLTKLWTVWSFCFGTTSLIQSLLNAVSAITFQNGPYISNENLSFILSRPECDLFHIANNHSYDFETRKTAVQCLAGICVMCENGDQLQDDYMRKCLELFISTLQEKSLNAGAPDIPMCRMIFSLVKGLNNILSSNSSVHLTSIGPLLSVLKKFMLYGLPGYYDFVPDNLQPDKVPDIYPGARSMGKIDDVDTQPRSSTKVQSRKKKRKNKSRPRSTPVDDIASGIDRLQFEVTQSSGFGGQPVQLRPAWARVTSSESEYSDTEGARQAKFRSFLCKIRQVSLGVLYLTVKKTDKQTMLGYWSSFLPDSLTLHRKSAASLFTSFREDPSPKCRAAALGVVGALLEGSRGILAISAEEIETPQTTSYVSFSESLAASVRELHKQLLAASSKEQSTLALVQLLKTFSLLVINTPYQRLRPGLLAKVAAQSRYYLLNSRDINVRISCLTLLGSIMSTSVSLGEVAKIITDPNAVAIPGTRLPFSSYTPPPPPRDLERNDCGSGSWLVDHCISLASPSKGTSSSSSTFEVPELPHPLRVEALQTLSRVIKGYLEVIKCYITPITDLICICLHDSSSPVRLHSCKLLEELGSSLSRSIKTNSSQEMEKISLDVWKKCLAGPLQTVLQEQGSPALHAKACDSLSTIAPSVFQTLPRNLQILCITLLLGLTSDEATLVRATSVRALGVYIMFPCLREDVSFCEDVAGAVLHLLEDPLLNVRANAAWSLGNLTDTIVINKETNPTFHEEFQDSFLLQIINAGLKSMKDKDKVRFNMMRVYGNVLRFVSKRHAQDEKFKPVMLKSTELLAEMVASNAMVKVRWNACMACSNFLRNHDLPLGEPQWTERVYRSLCTSVMTCKNYKVRIKAALALSTPTLRSHYGSMFSDIFTCMIEGLKDSDTASQFAEFKFKDTLQDQLCTTLMHLAVMIKRSDISNICAFLKNNVKELNEYLSNYHTNIVHRLNVEKLKDSSLNSTSELYRTDKSGVGTGQISDALYEYIVAKPPTDSEKLVAIREAVVRVCSVTALDDCNENDIRGEANKKEFASRVDCNMLWDVFHFHGGKI